MRESSRAANADVGLKIELLIVDTKVDFELFIGKKVAAVRWYAAQRHYLRSSVEPEEAHFLVESIESLPE